MFQSAFRVSASFVHVDCGSRNRQGPVAFPHFFLSGPLVLVCTSQQHVFAVKHNRWTVGVRRSIGCKLFVLNKAACKDGSYMYGQAIRATQASDQRFLDRGRSAREEQASQRGWPGRKESGRNSTAVVWYCCVLGKAQSRYTHTRGLLTRRSKEVNTEECTIHWIFPLPITGVSACSCPATCVCMGFV